jgi:hypothetical protein
MSAGSGRARVLQVLFEHQGGAQARAAGPGIPCRRIPGAAPGRRAAAAGTRSVQDGVARPSVRLRLRTARSQPGHGAWTPSESVDARIYGDVLWVLGRYGVRVSAAREAARHTTAPAPWTSSRRPARDVTAGRLAHGLGWTEPVAAPPRGRRARSCPPSSGSATTAIPATDRGGPAREDPRRTSTSRGCRAAMAPARSSRLHEVMAFPVPAEDTSAQAD